MGDATAGGYLEQRRLCLDHARDLIACAERAMAGGEAYPNIAYHLAILALEEIGKAGMLCARGVTNGAWDGTWIDKHLDDHVFKLMWAVWSPSIAGGKLDPKDFEDARRFAESTHERRMAGLYVNVEDGNANAPRRAVATEHATSLLKLAATSLAAEDATVALDYPSHTEELQWYLAAVSDPRGHKRLFSRSFVQKYEELGGDARAWIRWAREEFTRVAADEDAALRRELSRQATQPGHGKPKWLMTVRVRTPSHSLRPKALAYWNDRIRAVKLRTTGPKNRDLQLEMTIDDHVTVEQLFDFGLAFSKMHLAMLNIGTAGFFWYELSDQTETYYDHVRDLGTPGMSVFTGRASGLPRQWEEGRPDGRKSNRVALEEAHLNTAIKALGVFGAMPDKGAEPIFGPYLEGLTLLSKSDVHLSLETESRDLFLKALRRAMHHFGDLEALEASVVPALCRVTASIIKDEADRTKVFGGLDQGGKASVANALDAKRATDIYLSLVAHRLWPALMRQGADRPDRAGDD